MKTVLTRFLAISSLPLLLLASCKKNDPIVKINGNGTAGTLSANTQNLVLAKANYGDTSNVITFSFTKASYGFSAAVTNTLQIDSMGDNWKKPTLLTLASNVTSVSYNTADFNNLLLKLNLAGGAAGQIQVRVEHSLGPGAAPIYSNVLTLGVTPFSLVSYVYVAGTYQANQWTPAKGDSLVSPTGNGVYTGYVYFDNGGQFKVTAAPDWNHTNYGAGGSAGTISSSGGNLSSPGAGLYFVTVNTNANTITYSAYSHTWSLIGDAAVDWNTDFQMPFNLADNAYEVTVPLKASGGFKFRADNAWTLSFGNPTPVTGQLTSNGGANLSVSTDGTYLVKFTFGNPLLAPSYTATKQ